MHRWKLSALAAAAFVSAALTTTDAAALALGPLNVQSALGENLRAEISIPQATAAELNSLVAQIASPEVFRAQGMDYSGAARSIEVQLQRNADGTASLRLTSSAPIQDPFVDLVVSTQWSTGQIARSYTLLLDPPAAQRSTNVVTAAPQITPAAPSTPSTYSSAAAARPTAASTPPAPAASNPAVAPAARPAPAAAASTAPENTVRVRAGDTAGRIANAQRPSGVSLDQMLVAMLRSNPSAFINGNVNRIRAGAVVQMPSRDAALSTSASEARQIVAAQSRDFNAYRRSLASKAPQATVQAADRSSGGQVQAQVSESRAAADTPDKLMLSKGAIQDTATAEAQLAAQKQAAEQDDRLSELQRNLAELNQLAQTTTEAPVPALAAPTPDAAATPAVTTDAAPDASDAIQSAPTLDIANASASVTAAAVTAEALQTPATEASTTSDAPVPATADSADATETMSAPAPAAPAAAADAAPTPSAQPPAATQSLMDHPLLVPAGAGLVALLLGLLGYSQWKRRRTAAAAQNPSLDDAPVPSDAFIGGSGGQQVDTSHSDEGASTMAYAPSQLDGGGDVDPVAEADVYLAYGRDVQAEEILKEALRSHPERLSIHVKLAEIYVKRQDMKALEAVAQGMHPVSQGQGVEWQRVVDMGRHMDPSNAYFASLGGAAAPAKPASSFAAALNAAQPAAPTLAATAAAVAATPNAADTPDFDLHLELPDTAAQPAPAHTAPTAASSAQPSDADFAALDMSSALDSQLDMAAPSVPQDPPTLVQDTLMGETAAPDAHDLSGLDLDLSSFDVSAIEAPAPSTPTSAPAPTAPQAEEGGLDLDFDISSEPAPALAAAPAEVDAAAPNTSAPPAPAATAPAATAPSALDFDLGSLDLDLGANEPSAAPDEPVHNLADDPLSTKLDLAQEFNAIGDSEGARALVEEVLLEASGTLKERAQKLLSELD